MITTDHYLQRVFQRVGDFVSSIARHNLCSHSKPIPPAGRSRIAAHCGVMMLAVAAQALAVPAPFDYWSFDKASNRMATTSGTGTMSLVGSSYSYVPGVNGASDTAIQLTGTASPDSTYLRCYPNIAANGGGAQVNVYTMMWDVKYTNNSTWKCLLQTSNPPVNDGDVFINTSGAVGSSSNLGGYGSSTTAGTWYRIVLVVNTSSGSGDYDGKIFVNGVLAKQIFNLNVDSTLCLYAGAGGSFEIHCDDNGEDATFALSSFAMWNSELSNSDVAALGGPGSLIMKNNQTITFNDPGTQSYGVSPLTLSGSSDSGLSLSYSVVSGPATVNGSTLTITGAGSVTVQASQSGDGNFNAATSVNQTFTVSPANQSPVTWSTIPIQTYGGGTVNLASYVSGGSGTGAYVFGVISGSATVNGSTATFTGAGNVVFSAYKAADSNYNQSGTVNSASLTVSQASQASVTWSAIPTQIYGGGTLNLATYVSGGSGTGGYVYGVVSGPATVIGSTATFTGAGNVVFGAYRAADGNYSQSGTVDSSTVTINKATPTVSVWPSATAISYGQPLSSSTLSGGSGGGTFTFNSPGTIPSAGTYSAAVTFTPTDSADYNTVSGTVNVTVNSKNLTVTSPLVTSKTYDGSKTATITGTLSGVLGGDVVTLNGTGTFDDKNVGTSKVVTSTSTLGGANARNYILTQPTGLTGTINACPITVTAATSTKTYDGTISSNEKPTLTSGVIQTGDVAPTWTQSFDSQNASVPNERTLTPAGVVTDGNGGANYSYTYIPALGTINKVALTVTAAANTKTYDGNSTATTVPNITAGALQGSDTAGFIETYDAANVGTDRMLTPSGIVTDGNGGNNYSYQFVAQNNGTITARSLTVSATGENKPYDGTTAASVTLSDNRVNGDILTTTYSSAAFADKNVGTGKTVSVSGISVSGTDARNYSTNATTSTTADITAKALMVSATGVNKPYDGTSAASVTLTDNRVSGDILTTAYSSAAFADKNVGTGKTVSVSGISVSGTDAGNYSTNATASTTADITTMALTVSATGVNKSYDGTTTATVNLSDNRVSGDVLTTAYTTAAFADKDVGTGKTVSVSGISVSGADAGNYTANATASTTADITAKVLAVTADANSKTYGAADPALTYTSDALVGTDKLSGSLTRAAGENVGIYAIQQGTLSAGTNYTLSFTGADFTISLADQTITFGSIPNKTTTDVPFKLVGVSTSGLAVTFVSLNESVATVNGDQVTIVGEGTATIRASQAGNTNYNAAPNVDQTLTVTSATNSEFSPSNPAKLSPLPGGGQRVSFTGVPGRVYGIERSTDLVGWIQIATVTAGDDSSVTFDDPNPPQTSGFYRFIFPAR